MFRMRCRPARTTVLHPIPTMLVAVDLQRDLGFAIPGSTYCAMAIPFPLMCMIACHLAQRATLRRPSGIRRRRAQSDPVAIPWHLRQQRRHRSLWALCSSPPFSVEGALEITPSSLRTPVQSFGGIAIFGVGLFWWRRGLDNRSAVRPIWACQRPPLVRVTFETRGVALQLSTVPLVLPVGLLREDCRSDCHWRHRLCDRFGVSAILGLVQPRQSVRKIEAATDTYLSVTFVYPACDPSRLAAIPTRNFPSEPAGFRIVLQHLA